MGTKTIKLDLQTGDKIAKGIGRPLKTARPYFQTLGVMIDKDTQETFRSQGRRSGNPAWKPFSPLTLRMASGKFRIRYGTDKQGIKGGQGKPRKGIRRYSNSSKLLQASGLFRKSFRVMRVTNSSLKYGTVHQLGGKIGSNPERQVLFITPRDNARYSETFRKFIDKGIKF